jgi:hypothetical protein
VVHGIPAQVDLVSRADLRSAPERFLVHPPESGRPLGGWLTPLVIETDGTVVPLSHGFGRAYALGSLEVSGLASLTAAWDPHPLARLAGDLHGRLLSDGGAFLNWYERMARASASAPARAS